MWQSLNVQSRLEATEVGLGKLSSLVEDLISESAELQTAVQKHGTKKFVHLLMMDRIIATQNKSFFT